MGYELMAVSVLLLFTVQGELDHIFSADEFSSIMYPKTYRRILLPLPFKLFERTTKEIFVSFHSYCLIYFLGSKSLHTTLYHCPQYFRKICNTKIGFGIRVKNMPKDLM